MKKTGLGGRAGRLAGGGEGRRFFKTKTIFARSRANRSFKGEAKRPREEGKAKCSGELAVKSSQEKKEKKKTQWWEGGRNSRKKKRAPSLN